MSILLCWVAGPAHSGNFPSMTQPICITVKNIVFTLGICTQGPVVSPFRSTTHPVDQVLKEVRFAYHVDWHVNKCDKVNEMVTISRTSHANTFNTWRSYKVLPFAFILSTLFQDFWSSKCDALFLLGKYRKVTGHNSSLLFSAQAFKISHWCLCLHSRYYGKNTFQKSRNPVLCTAAPFFSLGFTCYELFPCLQIVATSDGVPTCKWDWLPAQIPYSFYTDAYTPATLNTLNALCAPDAQPQTCTLDVSLWTCTFCKVL